ncbi:ADP-ribosylglycohydrolase family protein [uncultured Microscilla sp.]|uniref:ADP-ribosylglycohydrolase family protein n=1 Tax=uncultured Microscilla sp. TaxID=432653 RepID=UPI003452E0D4
MFAASKINKLGFEAMLAAIIRAGGDTDTIGSIAGQLAGAYLGLEGLPQHLLTHARQLPEFVAFEQLVGSNTKSD